MTRLSITAASDWTVQDLERAIDDLRSGLIGDDPRIAPCQYAARALYQQKRGRRPNPADRALLRAIEKRIAAGMDAWQAVAVVVRQQPPGKNQHSEQHRLWGKLKKH